MRLFRFVMAPMLCGFAVMLVACAGSDSHPAIKPRQLDLSVVAEKSVNPDERGRAAPIVVRVYELKTDGSFKSADFFSLQGKDKTVLEGDLNRRDEFLLRPGETRTLRRQSDPTTTVIGILAAYRDLPHAVWRTTYRLPPATTAGWFSSGNKVKLNIDLGPNGVELTERK
jgi:type VI secretion system protein VasD